MPVALTRTPYATTLPRAQAAPYRPPTSLTGAPVNTFTGGQRDPYSAGVMSGGGGIAGKGGGPVFSPMAAGAMANDARAKGGALRAGLDAFGAGGGSSSGSAASMTGGGIGPGPAIPGIAPPNAQAGQDAALLRAKEKQGQIARSSLTGLREALGERQMLGSGAEAQATGEVASQAAQGISDVNREQLIQNDENARRLAELSYQGQIQQRGQDVTARGQDLQAAAAREGRAFSQQQQILQALQGMLY